MVKRYEVINHTADIGIRVRGRTLKDIFLNAGNGMVALAVASRLATLHSGARSKNIVTASAIDKEQLLVKWLQEIIYLVNSKRLIPVEFNIKSISERSLEGEVVTVPFDSKRDEIKYEIKAVTYHNLAIKKAGGQFEVSVIFDI